MKGTTSVEIKVGILAPSSEALELLRIQVSATGLGSVSVEEEQYCGVYGDRATRKFIEARPDIIIIDMENRQAALRSLNILHAALPDTWLFVSSEASDPQLIIEAMRAGAREFLPKPLPPRNLTQALSRFLAEKQRLMEAGGVGKIYCVTAAKGGTGVTSIAINLATSLVEAPKTHVALIDLNSPVGDAVAHLNLKPQFTVSDALESSSRLDPVLLESYMSHSQGLSVLAGAKEFRPGQMPDGDALARMLEVATRTYTHCVIDLPCSLDKERLQLVTGMAASIVVVSVPELPALWRTERLLRYLATCAGTDKLRLVINRRLKTDEITDSEIERVMKYPVYWNLPNNYKGSIRAINTGIPLVSKNHSELARSYRELAYALAEIPLPEKRRGLFGLFS
jgi:pilus assembly protein CpaE